MTSVTTYKLELTHQELALVIRGLRAVTAQIALQSTTLRGSDKEEADAVENLRRRLAVIYSNGNIRPYPYG